MRNATQHNQGISGIRIETKIGMIESVANAGNVFRKRTEVGEGKYVFYSKSDLQPLSYRKKSFWAFTELADVTHYPFQS